MVFYYQNCPDLLWEKIVLVIEKNFWNLRLKAENLKFFENKNAHQFSATLDNCEFSKHWINGVLLPKLFWPTVRKKNVLVIEKNFWNSRLKAENLKFFEITRTIYSSSERSEQFLVTECFLTCSWKFLISNKLEKLEFKLEKIIGI